MRPLKWNIAIESSSREFLSGDPIIISINGEFPGIERRYRVLGIFGRIDTKSVDTNVFCSRPWTGAQIPRNFLVSTAISVHGN